MTGLTADPAQQILASLFNDPLLGGLTQSGSPRGVPAKSNLQYLGIASHADGAVAASGVCCAVPIGVAPGDTFSTISVPIGATAAVTPTHSFGALYSGLAVPALLGQSPDGLTAAVAANGRLDFTLAAPITVTQAQAPNGFIYASFSLTAVTLPTALGVAIQTGAAAYRWFTGMPLFYALTHGAAVGGVAPATITGQAVKSPAPYVILS